MKPLKGGFFCGKRIDFLIYDFRLSDFFPLANAS